MTWYSWNRDILTVGLVDGENWCGGDFVCSLCDCFFGLRGTLIP